MILVDTVLNSIYLKVRMKTNIDEDVHDFTLSLAVEDK